MRFPVASGLAMGAGVVALGLFASCQDGYYGDGTTHCEHTTRTAVPSSYAYAVLAGGH